MKEKIKERVEAGIEFLNERLGTTEWVSQIDLESLTMELPSKCILGQLRPSELGVKVPYLDDEGNYFAKCSHLGISLRDPQYGFSDGRAEVSTVDESRAYYELLTQEWKRQLAPLQAEEAVCP